MNCIEIILAITLYAGLGLVFNIWAFNGDIKKYKWLLSETSELYCLYKLLVILILIIIFLFFSPIVFLIILYDRITRYFKKRKINKQIALLEKVVKK